ncbi:MAG: hypothetical protein KF789_09975 [Bdellovibrionaceae bacterium]|nr:hypothetical protein [Pseudobdellovibrionaceae bacterium]
MILSTPGRRLALVFGVGVFLVAFTLHLALRLPQLGFQLQVGDLISSQQGSIQLTALDLVEDPGAIEDFSELTSFYENQDLLSKILTATSVQVDREGNRHELSPRARHLSDLSVLFWTQVFVACGALIISGWIWAIRSRDLASTLFAISGLAVCLSALPSAIYTTREGGVPHGLFRLLAELNGATASLFGISMIALFLVYPIRLKHWKKLIVAETVILGAWTTLSVFKAFHSVTYLGLIMVTEMFLICLLISIQFFATSKDLLARASLTWLGLSVLVGAGAFIGLNTIPSMLDITPLSQGYAFLFFLIIYLGLAAGLTQYRLFEVGQWAFRLLFYAVGALLLALLDAALVFGVGMDRFPAMGVALLAVGFLYLPVRESIWSLFSRRKSMKLHESLEQALHVALAPSETQRSHRWEELIRKIFDPLEVEILETPCDQVELSRDGLTLKIPAVANTPSLRVSYPWSGRALFNKESKALARQIVALVSQAESSRKAYDRGVAEERRRMAQDLHDDVGARLLTGLHSADDKFRPLLQSAIAEIRSIVSGMTGENTSLSLLLADLRYEMRQRLTTVKIELDWPASVEDRPSLRLLDYRQQKALSSAVREVVSNVIRHSGASRLQVQVDEEDTVLRISLGDDGRGFSVSSLEQTNQGFGLSSLRRRLKDAGGTFRIESSDLGTLVVFEIPYQMS